MAFLKEIINLVASLPLFGVENLLNNLVLLIEVLRLFIYTVYLVIVVEMLITDVKMIAFDIKNPILINLKGHLDPGSAPRSRRDVI